MITIFVSKEGYYINGEGVEAALRCSPALDNNGHPIFHELHHTYKVMFLALQMIARKIKVDGDIIVYNDSRIIDELNGNVEPFDDVCERWKKTINREIVPYIRSLVIFRKKARDFIANQMHAVDTLIVIKDPAMISSKINIAQQEQSRSMKARILDRFKRMWQNDK